MLQARSNQPSFFARLRNKVIRVPGTGIFLTRLDKGIPPIIVNYVKQGRSLHETVLALTVSFESVPRVRPRDRLRCEHLGEGFWYVTVHFGFVEIPDLPSVISRARKEGLPAWDEPTYYIERHDPIGRQSRSVVSRWRIALFAFMARNSAHAVDRFRIPSNALVEIGRRIEL
jgi:KUP system potassium uptake protein